jgi:hypothetical protein
MSKQNTVNQMKRSGAIFPPSPLKAIPSGETETEEAPDLLLMEQASLQKFDKITTGHLPTRVMVGKALNNYPPNSSPHPVALPGWSFGQGMEDRQDSYYTICTENLTHKSNKCFRNLKIQFLLSQIHRRASSYISAL